MSSISLAVLGLFIYLFFTVVMANINMMMMMMVNDRLILVNLVYLCTLQTDASFCVYSKKENCRL